MMTCNFSKSIKQLLAGVGLFALHSTAFATPDLNNINGGNVNGDVGQHTSITQTENKMVVVWNSFNLDANETVLFNQNTNQIALNRILDTNASVINGKVGGLGKLIFVNTNGFIIGQTGYISGGALVLSTLDINDDDFMNSNYVFQEDPASNGKIINKGILESGSHINPGSIGLIGHAISNEGLINAVAGNIEMAAGTAMTMSFNNGLLQFEVTGSLAEQIAGTQSAVNNTGNLNTTKILLQANVTSDIYDQAINLDGAATALGIFEQNGSITLRVIEAGQTNIPNPGAHQTDNPPINIIAGAFSTGGGLSDNGGGLSDNGGGLSDNGGGLSDNGGGQDPKNIGNTVNAISGEPNINIEVPSDVNTSLGLYNVEAPGIRLPEDQRED